MTPNTTPAVERMRKFRDNLHSALRSQEYDVITNGAAHPGLLEPMAVILRRLLAEFDDIIAPAMPTIPAGMVAWHGGDAAPEDWDHTERVMLRSGWKGRLYRENSYWHHNNGGGDIIAYTPVARPAATAGEVEEVAEFLWHRFAPAHHIEWADEPHRSEYISVANDVLATLSIPEGEKAIVASLIRDAIEGGSDGHADHAAQRIAAFYRARSVEPTGCPTPGACSCPAALQSEVERALAAIQALLDEPLQGPEHGAWDRGRRYGLKNALDTARVALGETAK